MKILIELSEEIADKIMADKQAFLDEMLASGLPITDINYATPDEMVTGNPDCPDCHGKGYFLDSTDGFSFPRICGLCKKGG